MNVEKALVQLKDKAGGGKALEVLHIVSYFASEDTDIDIFLNLFDGSDELKAGVELLKRHSLVQSGREENSIRIEKEVQTMVQMLLRGQGKEEAVLEAAIKLLSKFLVPVCFSHAKSVFNFAKEYSKLIKEHSSFSVDIIQGLMKVDKDSEAAAFGEEAVNVLKEFMGEYHPSTIAAQKGLGLALVCVKKPNEALEVLIEAYKKVSEIKGEKEVSETLTLIAKVMSSLTPEPELRLRQLVFGDVPVSETNNNSILSLWCKYALMLRKSEWNDEALPILVQVLEKRRQLLHPDDDDICDVEDSIAHVHLNQKDYQKALETFQKVYEKRKRMFGENCVKTIVARRGIADAYDSLDIIDEALIEYETVAEKFRQVCGEDHQDYLISLSKIAYIFYRQKELEKSYNLYTRIYDKYVAVLGEKDIQTLNVKYNIGSVLLDQGKIEEALSIWHEVLKGYFEVLGPEHSESTDLLQKIFVITQRKEKLNIIKNKYAQI